VSHVVRLRAIRERKGYSLRRLAARARIDHATIHRIEHGLTPTSTQVARLAKALDVNPTELHRALALSARD
jgi:transcriptional regulator with XRE-family HTH domain